VTCLSPKKIHYRQLGLVALGSLVAVGIAHFAYIAGVNDAMGRSAYVNLTFVRLEEQQCVRLNDMSCMKASWRMRAEVSAASAKRSNDGFGGNPVEAELAEYIRWVDALPRHQHPKN
jgi:hypothetical protein